MNFMIRGARFLLLLMPALALAMPAFACDDIVFGCYDEPGSLLVFPKFAQGTAILDNGAIEPNSQIEIAAVCPAPAPPTFTGATTSPQTCTPVNYEVEVH